jgi:hypothetical protein
MSLRIRRSAFGAVLALAAGMLTVSSAHAQETSPEPAPAATTDEATGTSAVDEGRARAQAFFDEAVALASNGDFPAACGKLEESLKLHDGLGTSFHLAGCWQKIGRTASAYRLFDKVASRARELGQTEREQTARSRMDALAPKLSRIRIDVQAQSPRTEVHRDGELVPESEWRKAVPVDRGSHEVRVAAAGKKPWSTTIDVDTAGTTVVVLVPPLRDVDETKAAHPAAQKPLTPRREASRPAPAEQSSGNGQRILGVTVAGVGAAGLAFGIVQAVAYLKHHGEAKDLCPTSTNCSNAEIVKHEELVDSSKRERVFAAVGGGVGGAALLAGAYLYFSAPSVPDRSSKHRASAALDFAPNLDGRGGFGATLRGRF